MANTPSYLPQLQAQWSSQLNALSLQNRLIRDRVSDLVADVAKNPSLQPQLDQARLAQIQAAQRYNDFIESGSDLIKVAMDAETRLRKVCTTPFGAGVDMRDFR